jgi:transposase
MARLKIVRVRLPKWVRCPRCQQRQPFRKKTAHWKLVKDLDSQQPRVLKVQVVYAKCLNSACSMKSFALPTPGIDRYQRATTRLQAEAIAGLIDDNSTLGKTAARLNRSLNTTASTSAIDRWKHRAAAEVSFREIVEALGFSGVLAIDEFKPSRSKTFDLIACDALRDRILYLETLPKWAAWKTGTVSHGDLEAFLRRLHDLGVHPWAIIFDMATVYPKQARKVFPEALIQFDYFHVVQELFRWCRNALIRFRKDLQAQGRKDEAAELWEHRWRLLKNMDRLSPREHEVVTQLIEHYRGTVVEAVLLFKDQARAIFADATTVADAYALREALAAETYWRGSWHLTKAMQFLLSWRFEYMVTHLAQPGLPRCGNAESCIRRWRLMEKARYGLTAQGRQDHLKLYQLRKYLKVELLHGFDKEHP